MSKKTISISAFYLTLNSLMMMVVPILLVPIISSGFGVGEAGLFFFSLAIVNFVVLLSDLGLSTYGVKKYNDVLGFEGLKVFYLSSMSLKLFIHAVLVGIAVTCFILFSTEKWLIASVSLVTSYFYSISPIWVVQAQQKFSLLLIFHMISKISLILIVYLCLELNLPFIYIFIFNAASVFFALKWLQSAVAFPVVTIPGGVSRSDIVNFLVEIKPFYANRLASSILVYSPSVVLGASVAPVAYAVYGVAEYFYKGFMAVTQVGNQALYPFISRTRSKKYFFGLFVLFGAIISCLAFIILIWNWEIINTVFGPEFSGSSQFIPYFVALGCVSFLNVFMGFPAAALYNNFRSVNASTMYATAFYLAFLLIGFSFDIITGYTIIIILIFSEVISTIIRARVIRNQSTSDQEMI